MRISPRGIFASAAWAALIGSLTGDPFGVVDVGDVRMVTREI
jgi:hypothetical protein